MKNRGFTLIELLVVVLIIGILSAIALPQYQKAVKKARIMQGVVATRTLGVAQEAYYLANGEYTDDADNLDVSVTLPSNWWMGINASSVYTSYSGIAGFSITYRYQQTDNENAGKLYCWAQYEHPEAENICKMIGTRQGNDSGGGTVWFIE